MANQKNCYCKYPSAFIYDDDRKKKIKHLFWGDEIQIIKNGTSWIKVFCRDEEGWMKVSDTQGEPLLDMIFLDVGQGDSCLIVTPKDEKIIIDAGKKDNLLRYLKWRYKNFDSDKLKKMGRNIKAIVISHPDDDHYLGLKDILNDKDLNVIFNDIAIYHNGIFVRKGEKNKKGQRPNVLEKLIKAKRTSYVINPIVNQSDLENYYKLPKEITDTEFSNLVYEIKNKYKSAQFKMLHSKSNDLPNRIQKAKGFSIQILAPIIEKGPNGKPALRKFPGAIGVTKNGHSIIILVQYGKVRILFVGDINSHSGKFLADMYKTRMDNFKADVFKVAHHGSSDFFDEFIESVNPYASVISSGDNENYSHPRADTLGILGKLGRGKRPLIFSTELARSSPDLLNNPLVLLDKRAKLDNEFKSLKSDLTGKKEALSKEISDLDKKINRSISVYGAINLRTDGEKILMCQKKEAPAPDKTEWDIYRLIPDKKKGDLVLDSGKKNKK